MKCILKVTSLCLCLLLCVSMCGCHRNTADHSSTTPTTTTTATYPETQPSVSYNDVSSVLDTVSLPVTHTPYFSYNSLYHAGNIGEGYDSSYGYLWGSYCQQRAVNPLSAFRVLQEHGLMAKNDDYPETTVSDEAVQFPFAEYGNCAQQYHIDAITADIQATSYPFSKEGAEDLLATLAGASSVNNRHSRMASAVINTASHVEMFFSPDDACYYAYFLSQGTCATFAFNIYFKSSDGQIIDDIAFDFIGITHALAGAAGGGISYGLWTQEEHAEVMAMIAAIETVTLGETLLDIYENGDILIPTAEDSCYVYPVEVPLHYTIADRNAAFTADHYVHSLDEVYWIDHCSVYSYRLRK